MPDIKIQTFAVRNTKTGAKARVHYSLDNRGDQRKCVTIYDRDYGRDLGKVFADVDGVAYENDTDFMTDYFDKGRVRIFEGSPLYVEVRAAVEKIIAHLVATRELRHAAKLARHAAKRAALAGRHHSAQA